MGHFPHADWFDTWEGRQVFASWCALRALLAPLPSPFIHHQLGGLIRRHRTVDNRLDALAPQVVVEIGAGLSARGIAYAERHAAVTYVEIDLHNVVVAKRRCLRGKYLPANYRLVAGDILQPALADCLPACLIKDKSLVVITEGLMPYLSLEAQRRAWRNVATLMRKAAHSIYLLDMYPRDRLDADPLGSELMLSALSLFTGTPIADHLLPTVQSIVDELHACGFATVHAVEPGNAACPGPAQPWLLLEARTGRLRLPQGTRRGGPGRRRQRQSAAPAGQALHA